MRKAKNHLGMQCKTGTICPESGVWKSESNPSTTIPLAKGNRFPPYGGKAVNWILKTHA